MDFTPGNAVKGRGHNTANKRNQTVMMRHFITAFIALILATLPAHAAQLAPYKDALFAYPAVVETAAKGRYRLIAYNKQRDIYERDAVPRRKAKRKYISSKPRWSRKAVTYAAAGATRKMFAVGERKNPAVTVIYLYGQGGNRFQGVRDESFGGNFNRLQNLMVRNNSLLLTPDYANFGAAGAADIAALLRARQAQTPRSRFIIACGSLGGYVCARLARNPSIAAQLDGILLLGSYPAQGFVGSAAFKQRVPLYIGHGTADTTSPVAGQRAFFNSILRAASAYPVRMVAFTNGVHGTPIRMVDWREELNWMLRQDR